jgi:hypothetical protein
MEYSDMSKIEDYPGPAEDQPEKEGVGSPADEGMVDEGIVKPPATAEEEEKEEQKTTDKQLLEVLAF